MTTDSQLLDKAWALREEAKFLDAYDFFMLAANQTDNLLERASILLHATTTLTQSGQQSRSRNQLKQIRELLETVDLSQLSKHKQDEHIHVLVGLEIEEAEILVTEHKIENAIEHLVATLARFKNEIQKPSRIDIYDEIQTRRAYFLSDLGQFEKATPILEEVSSRRSDDTIFLFYLGHCYFRAKRLDLAQQNLERAIFLGPRPGIAFQTHGTLGMVFYETGEYTSAKQQLEICAKLAPSAFIRQAQIWKWLEYTCKQLGLTEEARHWSQLIRPS